MKKQITLSIFFFTVLFTYSIFAQQKRVLRDGYQMHYPEKIMKPMGNPLSAGTYTIGSAGDFETINSVFEKLWANGIAGPVTLELIDTLYTVPTTQPCFYLSGPISGANKDNRITIKPAENKNVIIQGAGESVLKFSNTSYLTLDGVSLNGNTTLTIHALNNSQYNWNDCIDFIDNSDHNIIQYIKFISDDYNRGSAGISLWTLDWNTGISAPDSNYIQNNFVKRAGIAMYLSGSEKTATYGNIIKENKIGSEKDSLIAIGIMLLHLNNTIVEKNTIQNIKTNPGDWIQDKQNAGMYIFWCDQTNIRNNIIHNIKSSIGKFSVGIHLDGYTGKRGNKNIVYNNMIYDIQSISTNSSISGIQVWFQDNPNIYYNSIYLSGSGSYYGGSAALNIYAQCTNVVARNNILVNTRDEGNYCASAIYNYSTSNLVSDNNDLYYEENQYNCLVRIGSTKYNSLTGWQSIGKDLHSITESPNFIAPDLHIDESIPTNLEKRGAVIADINTDFDGDLRDSNLPDIGADEFNGKVVPGPLTGAYSVGTTGYFPTIDSAFKRLSIDGIVAPVTIELIDTLYAAPETETGFLLNGPISGADKDNRVTIKPAANTNVTFQGSGYSVLYFSNTSYLTLDGIALDGSALTIRAFHGGTYIYNTAVKFVNNSNHNVVQNITAISEDKQLGNGIEFSIDDPKSAYAPDSNLIRNNIVIKAGVGIVISGYMYNVGPVQKPMDNVISGNVIGTKTDTMITWGIELVFNQNTIVENNVIQNISFNKDDALDIALGINASGCTGTIIRNNLVHSIYNNSSPHGALGIGLSGSSELPASNNIIYNNMVYDIHSQSKQSTSFVAGIYIWYQANTQIYFNSVYLNGKGESPSGSAALYIDNNCSSVDAKNNILVNTRDESPYCASAIYNYSTSNLTSDNNDLYFEPNQYNCLVKIGGTKYNTLADWQTKKADLNSVSEMPNFITPHLHIDESIATNLESHGVPISGIDLDFEGDARDSIATDIGADEFNGTTVVGVAGEVIQPLTFKLEQNYPNPFNPATNIQYSLASRQFVELKIFNILGQEIQTLVNAEKTAGNYQVEFNAADLSSGVYFYRIRAGSFNQVRKMLLIK